MAGRYSFGGASRVIENLADNLGKKGVDITIGALKFMRLPPTGAYDVSKIPLHNVSKLKKVLDDFDIVHNHHPITNYLALISQRAFVYHYHGAPDFGKGNLLRFNMLLSIRLMNYRFDAIIAVSESGATDLKRYLGLNATHVIYNGVESHRFRPGLDEKFRKGTPQFLFVGNIYKHKNVKELVQALKELLKEYPEAHLQIVGNGHNCRRLRAFISELELDEHVELVGRVPDYELPYYYTSCDVYVTASRWELFGLPLLEAMACGKPIVASSIRPHIELVAKSKSGDVYSQGNIEDLCEKVIKTYENRGRYRSNALQFARKHDWSVAAERVLKIYAEILHN